MYVVVDVRLRIMPFAYFQSTLRTYVTYDTLRVYLCMHRIVRHADVIVARVSRPARDKLISDLHIHVYATNLTS
jgi:hypothetical protein